MIKEIDQKWTEKRNLNDRFRSIKLECSTKIETLAEKLENYWCNLQSISLYEPLELRIYLITGHVPLFANFLTGKKFSGKKRLFANFFSKIQKSI